jgi:hypothetical protein
MIVAVEKPIFITYFKCVFAVLVILRAIILHCHLWPISDLELFVTLSFKRREFRERLLTIKYLVHYRQKFGPKHFPM